MGELIPIMCDEVVPGDIFKISAQAVVRLAPMVAPILHEINIFAHYFFVPYRLLWNEKTQIDLSDTGTWEKFITGDEDGLDASTIPEATGAGARAAYGLGDYLGIPTVADVADLDGYGWSIFPMRAYNLVYNEFFRDENLIEPISLESLVIQKRAWRKDYFTSSLPWLQRGTAPSLPIAGTSSAEFDLSATSDQNGTIHYETGDSKFSGSDKAILDGNTVDLSTATTFDISDLRLAFQIQKFLERNARAGARYTEFLNSHFGVAPRDDRLNRPEYIGGLRTPIIVSEVLQTSQTDTTPQGNLAGHGIGVQRAFCGKYHAKEFGCIIGIMSIMPKAVYQQGISRQWRKQTKYDFYFPEFANLSEQAIETGEVYVVDGDGDASQDVFGYQGRYDELRIKHDMVVAGMRNTFDYWHMSRQFASTPVLNQSFIECVPRKDCFAAPSAKCCFVSFGNLIDSFRPIPVQAEPGLIDHSYGGR